MLVFSSVELNLEKLQTEYNDLRARLSTVGWISHGYVQDRGPGAGGPCYQWTRKVKGKTVSVALSEEQYHALRQAIENWKETQKILEKMQQLSRTYIFAAIPKPRRRKKLSKKVSGVN